MPDNDPGVSLATYLAHPTPVGVRFHCMGCHASHDVPIPEVIERLRARKLGDGSTGIREVARLADRACRCGAVRWVTTPAFSLE